MYPTFQRYPARLEAWYPSLCNVSRLHPDRQVPLACPGTHPEAIFELSPFAPCPPRSPLGTPVIAVIGVLVSLLSVGAEKPVEGVKVPDEAVEVGLEG